MTATKITIKTSGRTYNAILNPESEAYPKGIKLPEPESSKLGRGVQYRFEVTAGQLNKLVDFFKAQSEKNLAKGVTADQREDGYAIQYDLVKLEKLQAELASVSNQAG